MPTPTSQIPFYNPTPLRLRSCSLILTFCRRRLTLPLHLHLLMRIIIFLVLDSTRDFQLQGLGQNPGKDNEPAHNNYYYHNSPLCDPNNRLLLATPNKSRSRETLPVRMWIRPPWLCPTTFFSSLLPSCYPLPSL